MDVIELAKDCSVWQALDDSPISLLGVIRHVSETYECMEQCSLAVHRNEHERSFEVYFCLIFQKTVYVTEIL